MRVWQSSGPRTSGQGAVAPRTISFLGFTQVSLLFLIVACSRTAPKHVKEKELDPHEAARRVQLAIERAGGAEIWVKSSAPSDAPASSANRNGAPVEVLAVSSKYDAVGDAIKA